MLTFELGSPVQQLIPPDPCTSMHMQLVDENRMIYDLLGDAIERQKVQTKKGWLKADFIR